MVHRLKLKRVVLHQSFEFSLSLDINTFFGFLAYLSQICIDTASLHPLWEYLRSQVMSD